MTRRSTRSIPSRLLPRLFLSNLLFVIALHASKDWLLDFDVGVFWVVMRVLACGGFGVLVWEGVTGQLAKRKTIEVSIGVVLDSLCHFDVIFLVVGVGNGLALALCPVCVPIHGAIPALLNTVWF